LRGTIRKPGGFLRIHPAFFQVAIPAKLLFQIMLQKSFRLSVTRLPGESLNSHDFRQRNLSANIKGAGSARSNATIPPEKLFADILKKQCCAVCRDVTQCDAAQMPAHLERLNFVSVLIRHAIKNGQVHDSEGIRSERQLCNPHTLADWEEVLQHTKQCHRAPAFLSIETEIQGISRKIDLIAGLLSRHPAMADLVNGSDEESEGDL